MLLTTGKGWAVSSLRHTLANCPKVHAKSINDRCKVRYGKDSRHRFQ